MVNFKIGTKHYIWRPAVLLANITKGVFALATGAFYAWAFISMIGGAR